MYELTYWISNFMVRIISWEACNHSPAQATAFYGTRIFSTYLKITSSWSVYWVRLVQSNPSCAVFFFFHEHLNNSLQYRPRTSKASLRVRFCAFENISFLVIYNIDQMFLFQKDCIICILYRSFETQCHLRLLFSPLRGRSLPSVDEPVSMEIVRHLNWAIP